MIEKLILEALPDLRDISFHSNGEVIARTGSMAKRPKKLYTGRGLQRDTTARIVDCLTKLIKDRETVKPSDLFD